MFKLVNKVDVKFFMISLNPLTFVWHKVLFNVDADSFLNTLFLSLINITYGDVKVKLLNDALTYYKAL